MIPLSPAGPTSSYARPVCHSGPPPAATNAPIFPSSILGIGLGRPYMAFRFPPSHTSSDMMQIDGGTVPIFFNRRTTAGHHHARHDRRPDFPPQA